MVAGSVYTCVEISAGVLFLVTRDKQGNGYYPGNGMVRLITHTQQTTVPKGRQGNVTPGQTDKTERKRRTTKHKEVQGNATPGQAKQKEKEKEESRNSGGDIAGPVNCTLWAEIVVRLSHNL